MKTIVITGPSASGKSYLCNKISKLFYNSIIIKTDSYYRDNRLIKFISRFLYDIYDRPLSIKNKELNNTLRSINNNDDLISIYKYDFKRKRSSKSQIKLDYKGKNQLLILEGIFAHRLDLNYTDTLNIICVEEKEISFKRRLKRDQLERGRDTNEISKKFNKSWFLFYKNVEYYLKRYKVLSINPSDNNSFNEIVQNIQAIKNKN